MSIRNLNVRAQQNFSLLQFSGQLQQNQPIADDSGGTTDNWVTLLTTRLSLEKRSGRLSDGMGKMEYQREYLLTCRKQNAIVIDADTRWLIGGEVYKIVDFDLVDQIPHWYQMYVIKNG